MAGRMREAQRCAIAYASMEAGRAFDLQGSHAAVRACDLHFALRSHDRAFRVRGLLRIRRGASAPQNDAAGVRSGIPAAALVSCRARRRSA